MKINFKLCFAPILLLLVGCAACSQPAQAAPLTLAPGVPIYLGAGEPEPVQRAARDLARDCRTVLGADSPIVTSRPAPNGQPWIEIIGPNAEAPARADAKAAIAGHEAHGIFAVGGAQGNRVALQGADMRGTIYAIYTFSEKFLGVKPLWFWASEQPQAQRKNIVIPERHRYSLRRRPYVRWRAWFPNDTDLFSVRGKTARKATTTRFTRRCCGSNSIVWKAPSPTTAVSRRPYPLGREVETARANADWLLSGHHIQSARLRVTTIGTNSGV